MNPAKIRLSEKEMELVTNAEWILTKNDILQKVHSLLGEIADEQKKILMQFHNRLPTEVLATTPKISKGENYKGLPYLVLDYPRYFDKENVCAIRTFFWWGNFFSITLHLSGRYKKQYEEKIISTIHESERFICIHDSEWEHHFEPGNYAALDKMSTAEIRQRVNEKNFLKLAQKIPLEQWDESKIILPVFFRQFLALLD